MTDQPRACRGVRLRNEPAGEMTRYDFCGHRVAITVPDPTIRRMVGQIFAGFGPRQLEPPMPASVASVRRRNGRWHVEMDGHALYTGDEPSFALLALEWRLVTDLVARRYDRFHVHGATLCLPSRACSILIPGESGSGKTTLTLGLMARGFLPYADDVSLIDPTTLAPETLRRAFHIDARTRSLIARLQPAPEWDWDALPAGYFLPPRWADQPAPLRYVLFPSLQPDATPHLTALSIADAAMALLPYSTTLAQRPDLALATAARLTAHARTYRLVTGDVEATVRTIVDLVATVHA